MWLDPQEVAAHCELTPIRDNKTGQCSLEIWVCALTLHWLYMPPMHSSPRKIQNGCFNVHRPTRWRFETLRQTSFLLPLPGIFTAGLLSPRTVFKLQPRVQQPRGNSRTFAFSLQSLCYSLLQRLLCSPSSDRAACGRIHFITGFRSLRLTF